jgi:hypothetical protein
MASSRACTSLSQRHQVPGRSGSKAPPMAARRVQSMFHDQLIKDCALQVDFRKLATLFGTQLIEMPEALHALNRSCNWPATALERACCFSTQDGR